MPSAAGTEYPSGAALLTKLLAGAVEFLVWADCCAAAALLISSNDALYDKIVVLLKFSYKDKQNMQ